MTWLGWLTMKIPLPRDEATGLTIQAPAKYSLFQLKFFKKNSPSSFGKAKFCPAVKYFLVRFFQRKDLPLFQVFESLSRFTSVWVQPKVTTWSSSKSTSSHFSELHRHNIFPIFKQAFPTKILQIEFSSFFLGTQSFVQL